MIDIRKFEGLSHRNIGWLDTRRHFNIRDPQDPTHLGWGRILVWNDESIAPKSGFPAHPHSDMEIITVVRSGALTHRDSMGNQGQTEAGQVQVMSAGTGVAHAEFNLEDEKTDLFQIWILPDRTGGEPNWDLREFPRGEHAGRWEILASGDPERDGGVPIYSDARLLAATLSAGESVTYDTTPSRHQYLVITGGRVRVNGQEANPRDGIAITGEDTITVEAIEDCELVMVDAR